MAKGRLIVNVYVDNIALPVSNARVRVVDTAVDVFTNDSGQTEEIILDSPDIVYSEKEQNEVQPYSNYNIVVEKEGLTTTTVFDVEIFPDVLSIQDVYLTNESTDFLKETTVSIDPPTLFFSYPPTIFEETDQSVVPIVLQDVVVPEYIVVHDGIPSNKNASDYRVNFVDYVKNVACCEIYSTWPVETIKANVLAIISFVLNRIYTEWYVSKGYLFTITSTTTYDQKYTHGRTIFEPISRVVDDIFNNYIRIMPYEQPLLAHYQSSTSEIGYLSQWGSKYLGDQGYSALEILKYYYGNNVLIDEAMVVTDYVSSYNKPLRLNDCSNDVQIIQNQLNYIRGSYPAIPKINDSDGVYNIETDNAVKKFQSIFNLTVDGVVDFATWYKISYIYVSVRDMLKSVY